MNAVAVLIKAYELIEPDGAWTQFAGARSKTGRAVNSWYENAICWCIYGALNKFNADPAVFQYLYMAVQTRDIIVWNDIPYRTHEEVREAFRKAIALAKAGEA